MQSLTCKTGRQFAATIVLALVATAAVAQTSRVDVDALANCANLNGGEAISAVYTGFDAGTYAVKVKSSNATYCANGGCAHPDVAITIDDGVNFHTDTVVIGASQARTLTFGGPAHVWAYFIDTQCDDNAGRSVLQFTQR